MKPTLLARHDPRRYDALGLVRRQVKAGTFTKADVAAWKEEIGVDDVDEIVQEFAPKKAAKAATSKKAGSKDESAAPDKE